MAGSHLYQDLVTSHLLHRYLSGASSLISHPSDHSCFLIRVPASIPNSLARGIL